MGALGSVLLVGPSLDLNGAARQQRPYQRLRVPAPGGEQKTEIRAPSKHFSTILTKVEPAQSLRPVGFERTSRPSAPSRCISSCSFGHATLSGSLRLPSAALHADRLKQLGQEPIKSCGVRKPSLHGADQQGMSDPQPSPMASAARLRASCPAGSRSASNSRSMDTGFARRPDLPAQSSVVL
jgi:hypothetical protein